MNAPLTADQLKPLDQTETKPFRDLDAERAELRSQSSQRAITRPLPQELSVFCVGLRGREMRRLQDLVIVSRCHSPQLTLLPADRAHAADLLIVDPHHEQAREWLARQGGWLRRRAVLWVDVDAAPKGHATLARPIAWHSLPQAMVDAFALAPPVSRAVVTRCLQPGATAVLVLSADAACRERWSQRLEAVGRRSTLAATAREGLAALHAAPYGAIIVEQDLSDLDGLRLVRRLRGLQGRLGQTPMVMVNPAAGALLRWRARLAGCDEVLSDSPHGPALTELLQRLSMH